MSTSTVSRSIGVALAVVGLGLVTRWALTEDERPASPPARVVAAARPAAPVPRQVPAIAAPEPDLEASLDGFFGALQVTAPASGVTPQARLARAAADGEDPVTTRLALEELTRRDAAARVALADALADLPPADARFGFPAALALAAHLDGPSTERLLARLADASARNRPNLVFALRGSAEPRADAAFADLYRADRDPAVRDAAAFVLGERAERLSDDVRRPALARARAALSESDPAGWAAAADVLGAPPLAPDDRALLVDLLAHDREPGRRLLALRALAGANVPASDLRPALEAAASDPLADEALRAAARLALERA